MGNGPWSDGEMVAAADFPTSCPPGHVSSALAERLRGSELRGVVSAAGVVNSLRFNEDRAA